jgi:hypothetical protein
MTGRFTGARQRRDAPRCSVPAWRSARRPPSSGSGDAGRIGGQRRQEDDPRRARVEIRRAACGYCSRKSSRPSLALERLVGAVADHDDGRASSGRRTSSGRRNRRAACRSSARASPHTVSPDQPRFRKVSRLVRMGDGERRLDQAEPVLALEERVADEEDMRSPSWKVTTASRGPGTAGSCSADAGGADVRAASASASGMRYNRTPPRSKGRPGSLSRGRIVTPPACHPWRSQERRMCRRTPGSRTAYLAPQSESHPRCTYWGSWAAHPEAGGPESVPGPDLGLGHSASRAVRHCPRPTRSTPRRRVRELTRLGAPARRADCSSPSHDVPAGCQLG